MRQLGMDTKSNHRTDSSEPFYPYVFSGEPPVKNSYFEGIAFLTFAARMDEETDILVSPMFWASENIADYDTLSSAEAQVRNAKIYMGKDEPGCKTYFPNVWEEKVGDYWQLKYAETFACLSDLEENTSRNSRLKIYPNPFQETTRISFELENEASVLLNIHDANGRVVEALENKKLPKGVFTYNWTGNQKTSGAYFVILSVNSKVFSKKIILTEK